MSELIVLDHTGDTRIQWNRDDDKQVNDASSRFKELTKKGYAAFSVNAKGDQGKSLREFDPNLERIIFVPPLVGG